MAASSAKPPADILRFLHALWSEGDVRELRLPKHNAYNQTASGYFESPEAMAASASKWDGRANAFVTLNPVLPDLLARARNRTLERAENTTADLEVQKRSWLFLDIDPVRPSGISSTEAERASAHEVLDTVLAFLTEQDWPSPITAMSGNGYYALYRIDLPNDLESTSLLKAVLDTLAKRFDTPAAHIDTTVHNAARIIGLIGTKKVKGDATDERPHRRSHLLDLPDQLLTVTETQLRALVAREAPENAPATTGTPPGKRSLVAMLDGQGIQYREQAPDANGLTWYHVERCPFHDDGRAFECGVGQKLPDGPYAGHCFHPEGQDKGWQEWKIALGIEAGPRHLRTITNLNQNRRPTEFALTDAGNAELFAHLFGDQLRHDHRRHHWFYWDEHHWSEDLDASVVQRAIEAVRQRYLDAVLLQDLEERARQSKFAVASENRQRLDAMLAIARSKPPIADRGDSWDANPWLLGVSNGVVNLKTGQLLDGRQVQKITRFADIQFDPNARCPRWLQFLEEVFGDPQLVEFIHKAVGYSLTGDVSEQCVFTCFGTGSNGKSVFLNLLRELAGGYAYNAPFSILELKNQSLIPNDVAALAGARLVTASETNDGTRLNEARLKALTGGDPITARFLHGEFFTFNPLAKIWLAVNHRPRVSDQSHGFWRRLRLIPFERTFSADQDKQLATKLRRELPGILAWAVRGCLAWQEEGLRPPTAVELATEAYRKDSDPLAEFIDDCCMVRSDATCGANEAYLRYSSWASSRGMKESERLSSTLFGTRMTERFAKKRSGKGNVYVGIGLLAGRPEPASEAAPVQSLVQGSGFDAGFSGISPLEKSSTREQPRTPYTTLHPTQPELDETCAECEEPPWTFSPHGKPLCEKHARAGAPT